jgi:predicted Zn-dependent protease
MKQLSCRHYRILAQGDLVGAGFNPYGAAGFLGRITMFQGDTGLNGFLMTFISDHPTNSQRISDMRRVLLQWSSQTGFTGIGVERFKNPRT